jgi:hemoglobin-like flavoprotein
MQGEMFMRKCFELESSTKEMFGFPADTDHDDPALSSNQEFISKGVRLIEAVDTAVGFLGPDLEPLENTLFQLGGRHVARRCRPSHWPMVGDVLFYIFEQGLGDDFTPKLREAWTGKLTLLRRNN